MRNICLGQLPSCWIVPFFQGNKGQKTRKSLNLHVYWSGPFFGSDTFPKNASLRKKRLNPENMFRQSSSCFSFIVQGKIGSPPQKRT